MPFSRSIFFFLFALVVAGCVTRADFEKVRQTQQEMRARLADTQVAVDRLNRSVDTVRARLDDGSGGAGTASFAALERRITELETRLYQAPVGVPGQPPSSGTVVALPRTEAAVIALGRDVGRQQQGAGDEDYARALRLYREGQAEQANQQFRAFLRANPKSELADNAQYWLGEIYYSQGDYNRAIIELNEVLLKYPQGDQVPGALLALATAFANSGDKIDARLILQKLINDHPDSEEAEAGRKQLEALRE